MYYLFQSGETTGPFAEGRLVMMWQAGELTPDAQLAYQGTEDWLPVDDILRPLVEEQKSAAAMGKKRPAVVKEKYHPYRAVSWTLVAIGILAGVLVHWVLGLIWVLIAVSVDLRKWRCGNCKNRVEKGAVQCPVCGVQLRSG